MPPIVMMILSLLGGFGGQFAAGKAAPIIGRKLGQSALGQIPFLAKLFGNKTVKSIAGGAGSIAAFGAGHAATDVGLQELFGSTEGGPEPHDPIVEDIIEPRFGPQELDNIQGLQGIQQQEEMRQIFAALGVDMDALTQQSGGLV